MLELGEYVYLFQKNKSNGEEYSIIDMNSTNHTYINNQMIQSGVEVKLNDGDKVKLGNEEFEFKER